MNNLFVPLYVRGMCVCSCFNSIERNWTLASNSKFIIIKSLQPKGVQLCQTLNNQKSDIWLHMVYKIKNNQKSDIWYMVYKIKNNQKSDIWYMVYNIKNNQKSDIWYMVHTCSLPCVHTYFVQWIEMVVKLVFSSRFLIFYWILIL